MRQDNSTMPSPDEVRVIPHNTRFTFANGQTSKVDWNTLEQGHVRTLPSVDQMQNLHMTIEHTSQCDKITRKAWGTIRQPIPVSSTGHALLDLADFCRQHDRRLANKACEDDKMKPVAYPPLLAASSRGSGSRHDGDHRRCQQRPLQKESHPKELQRVHVSKRRALFTHAYPTSESQDDANQRPRNPYHQSRRIGEPRQLRQRQHQSCGQEPQPSSSLTSHSEQRKRTQTTQQTGSFQRQAGPMSQQTLLQHKKHQQMPHLEHQLLCHLRSIARTHNFQN